MPKMIEKGTKERRDRMAPTFDSRVHPDASPCYDWFMKFGAFSSLRYRIIGAGAVLLVGIAHSAHDLLEGHPAGEAFLPSISIALQVATLSLGQSAVRLRGWTRTQSLVSAVLVSIFFGCMTVVAHGRPENALLWTLGFWFLAAGMGVLGFWFLMFYFPEQLSEARTQALAAENERRKADLTHLRANLHPHFLLNTLNAVAGLVVSDPKQARQLLIALGDLLRDSLEDSDEMRPLSQEVEWLRRYAEIFEIRHRGAVRFEWDLSADTLQISIPRLLLQPLIENAIAHGALKRPGGGAVSIRSQVTGEMIHIAVSDNGPGMASKQSSGLGLRLVHDRLLLAYPKAKMSIDSSEAGTSVTLTLPKTENAK